MDSLNHDKQACVIEDFISTSRYLDDLLDIGNHYFEGMVKQMNSPELQLNKKQQIYRSSLFRLTFLAVLFMVYKSGLPVSNNVADFNAPNKCLTAKPLKLGYRYHKFRKRFSNFIADIMN